MAKKEKAPKKKSEKIPKVDDSPEVSFISFFLECVRNKMVQPWQDKEIRAFFYQLGLRDKEPSDTYKDALAKY